MVTDNPDERRLGLALSGGGFRASLFHLGVIRALREADMLQDVKAISSVSGGSILAAHLVLNWDRYTSEDPEEFDAIVDEFLTFVRLGPRGRILHRLPWLTLYGLIARLPLISRVVDARLGPRTLLIRRYLSKLYRGNFLRSLGDSARAGKVVGRPDIYILSTNLTTGGLCAFTSYGIIPSVTEGDLSTVARDEEEVERETREMRMTGTPPVISALATGMSPIALAVSASSAFPQLFPPERLSVGDLGVERSGVQADPQFLTDGGVIDNSGLSAFESLYCEVEESQGTAPAHPEPLEHEASAETGSDGASRPSVPLPHPPHPRRRPVLKPLSIFVHGNHRQNSEIRGNTLDLVISSNAGVPLDFQAQASAGFIGSITRSVDILMNRISNRPRSMIERVEHIALDIQDEDPNAKLLHADVQRRLKRVRTDLDHFTDVEISALVRHGYAIAWRQLARKRLGSTGGDLEPPEPEARPAWRTKEFRGGGGLGRIVGFFVGIVRLTLIFLGALFRRLWGLLSGSPLRQREMQSGGFSVREAFRRGWTAARRSFTRSSSQELDPAVFKPTVWERIKNFGRAIPSWFAPANLAHSWRCLGAGLDRATGAMLGAERLVSYQRRPRPEESGEISEIQRARALMGSSKRRLLSGASTDIMVPINVLVVVYLVMLGGWNLYRYATAPDPTMVFDDYQGTRWDMSLIYDKGYAGLYLRSVKSAVHAADEDTRKNAAESLPHLDRLITRNPSPLAGDGKHPTHVLSEEWTKARGKGAAGPWNYVDDVLALQDSFVNLPDPVITAIKLVNAEQDDPEVTAKATLKANTDRASWYWPFADSRSWSGRGRVRLPTREQVDLTFKVNVIDAEGTGCIVLDGTRGLDEATCKALEAHWEVPEGPDGTRLPRLEFTFELPMIFQRKISREYTALLSWKGRDAKTGRHHYEGRLFRGRYTWEKDGTATEREGHLCLCGLNMVEPIR